MEPHQDRVGGGKSPFAGPLAAPRENDGREYAAPSLLHLASSLQGVSLGFGDLSSRCRERLEKVRNKRKENLVKSGMDAANEPIKNAARKTLTCLLYQVVSYSRHYPGGLRITDPVGGSL